MKFLILNGPNVNLQRYSEPGMPGELDYNGMMDYVQSGCDQMGIETDVCQTNHEGDLIDEIQANFTSLLTQYPAGMRVNALLAARNFAVHQQNILVGNGAAELIKALMARLEGVTGFIRPTFEEYPNR